MKKLLSLLLAFVMLFSCLPVTSLADNDPTALILPVGIETVDEEAFAGDTTIETVVIGKKASAIGKRAFAGCTGLKAVSIGSMDIEIADNAFEGCGSDIVFYAHDDSTARLWALAHGYEFESLDADSDSLAQLKKLIAISGFNGSGLMSSLSECLIVRTTPGYNHLPDISAYDPVEIFKSEASLYYVQFEDAEHAEQCAELLMNDPYVINVEADRVLEYSDAMASGITEADSWGSSDVMGFDVYSTFVAERTSGNVTIAVIDSGMNSSAWSGKLSAKSRSYVDTDPYTDSLRHGSKVASVLNDCLGEAVNNCTMMSLKVKNSNAQFRTIIIIEALKQAINGGADIINMSFGWESVSNEVSNQILNAREKGILLVAASGNGTGAVMYPAKDDGVIAVSALSKNESTGYTVNSRTGSEIAFTAPGTHLSTSAYPQLDALGDASVLSSTSFAAPQIAAALALIKLDPTHTGSAETILAGCCESADELGLPQSNCGNGLPQLDRLAVIDVSQVTLKNVDGKDIPSTLWVGEDFLLTWDILPDNASDKTAGILSNDSSILSVKQYSSNISRVKAQAAGEATVTVTAGKVSTHVTIHVLQQVNKISILGAVSGATLKLGDTMQLAAEVKPGSASDKTVIWRSLTPGIAEVSDTGLVTPIAAGQAKISCEAADGYGTSAQIELNVVEVPDAESITLTADEADISSGSITLEKGETLTLHYEILPELAPQEVSFTALPAGIVTISDEGVLTAVEAGTVSVIAAASTGKNVLAFLSVKVVISPTAVEVSTGKTVLDLGEITVARANISPADATENKITWSSTNSAVAEIDSNGIIAATGKGTAEITATTANGISDSVVITVRKPITISFNANGTNVHGDLSSIGAYSGYAVGTLPVVTRDYYEFLAWFTSDGTKINETSIFEDDVTLFAHWTENPFTIVFDANGGSCATTEQTASVNVKIGALPTPERDSYTFLGWFTEPEGGEAIISDYIQSNDSELKLYAHWQANPYTVTLDANGGSCTEKTLSGTVDSAIGTLPVPTRNYYSFDGWYTGPDYGIEITSSYVKTDDNDITVYAHWTANKYNITFDVNGGSCDTSSKQASVDSKIGKLPVASLPYYDFVGWYTAKEGGTRVTGSYSKADDGDMTVYAHWQPHTYTISFNANGGSAVTAISGTVDKAIGTLPESTRSYYDFDGWYTAADGGTKVDGTYKQSTDSELTLYAHWTAQSYTMSFDANGGSCDTESTEGTVGTAIGTLPVPARSYYSFLGWFTAEAGGTQVTEAYIQTTTDPITVYAHWDPNSYDIKLDLNTGDANSSVITVSGKVGTELGTLSEPTRSYYQFHGWFTAATGGEKITASYVQDTDDTLTLYAHWEAFDVKIYFNANGADAEITPSSKTVKVDSPVGELPVPTRDGFSFLGWFLDEYNANKNAAQVDSKTVFTTDASVTLYARWQSGWVETIPEEDSNNVIEVSYSYTRTAESKEAELEGFIPNGYRWDVTGVGEAYYGSFPETYYPNHWTILESRTEAFEAYETETAKREVENNRAGWYYWHWMYDTNYYNVTNVEIYNEQGPGPDNDKLYYFFYAFTSEEDAPYLDNDYCNSCDLPSYDCSGIIPSADKINASRGGAGNPRMFRFERNLSSYIDFEKVYLFKCEVQYSPDDPGNSSNIIHLHTYYKYIT